MDIDKTKQSNETNRDVTYLETRTGELNELISSLTSRIAVLEGYFNNGLTSTSYYVCNNDGTYNASNSKVMTVNKGIITDIS